MIKLLTLRSPVSDKTLSTVLRKTLTIRQNPSLRAKNPRNNHLNIFFPGMARKLLIERVERGLGVYLMKTGSLENIIKVSRLASVGRLALDVAHDMSTPITAAIHYSGVLCDLIEDNKDSVTLPKDEVNKISQDLKKSLDLLTNQLVNLKTYAADTGAAPFENASVEFIFRNALALCHSRFKKFGIELTHPKVSPNLQIECHPNQIQQALVSLLINAIDAVRETENAGIGVEITDGGDFVEIKLSNNGPAIPPEQREKIFDEFYTTKDDPKSAGMGLFLCRQLVERHSGKITVSSDKTETSFVMRLPKIQSPPLVASGQTVFSPS